MANITPAVRRCLLVLLLLLSACTRPGAQGAPAPSASQPAASAPSALPAAHFTPGSQQLGVATGCSGQLADLYYPDLGGTRVVPAVVYVHGGGWMAGSRSNLPPSGPWFKALRLAGYLFVSLDYRLAPAFTWPAQIQDVRCELQWLASQQALGVDRNRIALLGFSAGAQLVALAGLQPPPGVHIAAVITVGLPADLTRISDFNQALLDQIGPQEFGNLNPANPLLRQASPLYAVHPGAPDMLILAGQLDPLVNPSQSRSMQQALAAAGDLAQVIVVRNAGHSLDPSGGDPDPPLNTIVFTALGFLNQAGA